MPISEDRKTFVKLQMQSALEIVKADLGKDDSHLFPSIQTVLSNLQSLKLDWLQDSKADLQTVNTLLRNPLLEFLASGVRITAGKGIHYYVYKSLMLLSAHWPTNEYRYDIAAKTQEFICPLNHKPIALNNRLLLSTGSQINLERLPIIDTETYALIESDPCTQKKLTPLDRMHLGESVFASSDYKLHKGWTRSKNMLRAGFDTNTTIILLIAFLCSHNFTGRPIVADTLMFLTYIASLANVFLAINAYFKTNEFYKNAENLLLEPDEKKLHQMGFITELSETLTLIDARAHAPETFTVTIGTTSPHSANSNPLKAKPKKTLPPQHKCKKQQTGDEKETSIAVAIQPQPTKGYSEVSALHATLKNQLTRLQDAFSELRQDFISLRAIEFKFQFAIRPEVLYLGGPIDTLDSELLKLEQSFKNLKAAIEENKGKENHALTSAQLNKIPAEIHKYSLMLETLVEKIKKETMQAQHAAEHGVLTKKTIDIMEKLAEKERQRKAREDLLEQESLRSLEEKKTKPPRSTATLPNTPPLTPLSRPKHPRTTSSHPLENDTKPAQQIDRRVLRSHWMGQACNNIIHIKWILECADEMDWQVKEFALSYNIFHCFQALKMYQRFFGSSIPELDPDTIINLRNMMIHHGSAAVSNPYLLAFAEQIKNKLPLTLLNLNKKHLLASELSDTQRNDLVTAFGLKDSPELERMHHSSIFAPPIVHTPFYKDLARYNETKIDNNFDDKYYAHVIKIYVPLMSAIAFSFKVPAGQGPGSNEFLPTYLFQIQALYMLTTLCGEIKRLLPKTTGYTFNEFLNFCLRVRNEVGHELIDFSKYPEFVSDLQIKLSRLRSKDSYVEIADHNAGENTAPVSRATI
jgi:hypothetical protein